MKRELIPIALTLVVLAPFVCAQARIVTVTGTDSEAIAAAMAEAGPGDTVAVPAGTYAVHQALQPKSGTRLEGAGQNQTVLRFEGEAPTVLLSLSGCEDVEICHLTLDGNADPKATQGISGSDARRLNVHHVTIRNLVKGDGFGPHGILFSGQNPTGERGVTDSVIADCHIENIGGGAKFGGGIRLAWGSSRNRVLRNTIHQTGRGGVFADNGSVDCVIQHNRVSGSGGEGLGIEVWGGCDRSVIEDNTIDHWLSIGGCDYCAARRNTISDHSGAYTFCGIEGIGSCLVITDNTIDGGQKIGLSVSGPQPKQYVYWADNVVRACNQWGAQFQGEAGGIACHYLYRCRFEKMPVGVGPVWYPGDEGHGFRSNGHCGDVTFEECAFNGNHRLGIQFVGEGIDRLRFVRCAIKDNRGPAIRGPGGYTALEWADCTVTGNASDALPAAKPFAHPPPTAAFNAPETVRAGEPAAFANTSTASDGDIAAALWDFGHGPPDTDLNPTHTYDQPGEYRVTLIVWDTHGRAARAEAILEVAE